MKWHDTVKRALPSLLLLAALAATTDADAQRRRLPVRTDEIPDTESGRPAASADRPAFKGRMIIYGPQGLPVGVPPEHVGRPEAEPVAEPKPAPVPTTPSAAPAPVVAPAPAPVATPRPAPTPPAAVVIVPAAPPPEPVAVPVQPPPAPVAVPIPAAPPAVTIAAPAPAPTPPPAPAVAASAPRTPVVRDPVVREPAVRAEPFRAEPVRAAPLRPEPARPAAPAAPPRQEVALAAPSSAAAPGAPLAIESRLIERIFNCLSPGLPPDWKRVWVEITDQKDAIFRVSNIGHVNDEGEPLVPCNAAALTGTIVGLNEKLAPDRRAWKRALLVIESDGEYELSYDYGK